jgi:hypothetical protein
MDGIISYTDQIKKFISGKKYAGKNIQTSDGLNCYITKTGIAKPYNSPLTNTNGCTTAIERINSTWKDMGLPLGSFMAQGQSCGNETSYVQSMPPKTTFDWKFYIKSNPELNLTTEQQAYDHWKSAGIHKGLLPNSSILTSMSNVGKIGYVDINTTLHHVPKESVAYTGQYNVFNEGNVTGNQMQDCTIPPPNVKYGDQLVIKYGTQFGSMNQQSILEFGKNKTKIFLRPPIGEEGLNGTPIKYGDRVAFAISSSNVNTPDCGWWGCKVGFINNETHMLSFGPGGKNVNTFIIVSPPGTNYGNELKIGYPFALLTTVPQPLWKKDAMMEYAGNDIKHSYKSLDDCKTECSNTYGCAGILTDNSNKNNCWLKKSFVNGKPDNNRNAYMLNNNGIVANWREETGIDCGGNDMGGYNKTLSDCKATCASTTGCVGLVTDNNRGTNNCYLKNKMGNCKRNGRWSSHYLTMSKNENPPLEELKLAYMMKNGIIFENINSTHFDKIIFTFQDINADTYVMKCDVNLLQNDCNKDNTCTGFIHSNKDNTWQKMKNNSTSNMYKITDTTPNVYIKHAAVDMKDKSCNSGTSEFIDSEKFSHFPVGNNFLMNKDQCNEINKYPIHQKQKQYNNVNELAAKQGQSLINKYPIITPYTDKTINIYKQMKSKTDEYKTVLSTIKTKNEKYNDTYRQQNNDLSLLQDSNKLHVFSWGLSSIIVIAMVVMLKNRQT